VTVGLGWRVSERELRKEAVGRKNWLFVGSDEGGAVNATFVSLIASCQLHGIEPLAYLRDLFCLLPSWNQQRVLELSPLHWRVTNDRDDVRRSLAMPVPTGLPMCSGRVYPSVPMSTHRFRRCDHRFRRVTIGSDEWLQSPPSPRRVRPTHCPCCQAAAWIDGKRLRILGHGRRSRSVISQATSTSDALNHQFPGRRFRCAVDGCGAVMLAVPAGVLPKRRFSGPSIAFAIALFGHALASAGSVRRRLAPSTCGGDVWRQLRRWVRSAVEDRLFLPVPTGLPMCSGRVYPSVPMSAHRLHAGRRRPARRPWRLDRVSGVCRASGSRVTMAYTH
jgi:hypothetical protein